MKKHTIKCHEGCGKVLGSVELPDHVALTTQASGYTCEACSKRIITNRPGPKDELLSTDQRIRLEAFKSRLGNDKTVTAKDLNELIAILFQ
jgi:hypothetical protein